MNTHTPPPSYKEYSMPRTLRSGRDQRDLKSTSRSQQTPVQKLRSLIFARTKDTKKRDDPESGATNETEPDTKLSSTTSLRLRTLHLLDKNPGFCPGAFMHRQICKSEAEVQAHNLLMSPTQCAYCGVVPVKTHPSSFTEGWKDPTRLNVSFLFQNHVAVTKNDASNRRSCVICWEERGRWVEPMGLEEWCVHVRKHFEQEGYWACMDRTTKCMAGRWVCKAQKCRGIHS